MNLVEACHAVSQRASQTLDWWTNHFTKASLLDITLDHLTLGRGGRDDPDQPDNGAETIPLRRLARAYGVELVELRSEWIHYHPGKNVQEETWALSFTHITADKKHARFKLSGSKTGPDGEGDTDHDFSSASGRIFIAADDWSRPREKVPPDPLANRDWQPLVEPRQLVWHVLPDSLDTVHCDPTWRPDADYYCGQPYRDVTIADGLPCGAHELTLIQIPDPNPTRGFTIVGGDVPRPPLARDAPQRTTER